MIFEFSSTPNPIGDELLTAPLRPVAGVIHVPDGPGLGITFDEAPVPTTICNSHLGDWRIVAEHALG